MLGSERLPTAGVDSERSSCSSVCGDYDVQSWAAGLKRIILWNWGNLACALGYRARLNQWSWELMHFSATSCLQERICVCIL